MRRSGDGIPICLTIRANSSGMNEDDPGKAYAWLFIFFKLCVPKEWQSKLNESDWMLDGGQTGVLQQRGSIDFSSLASFERCLKESIFLNSSFFLWLRLRLDLLVCAYFGNSFHFQYWLGSLRIVNLRVSWARFPTRISWSSHKFTRFSGFLPTVIMSKVQVIVNLRKERGETKIKGFSFETG